MTIPLARVRELNYDHHRRMKLSHDQKVREGTVEASNAIDTRSYCELLAHVPKCFHLLELGSSGGGQWDLLREWLLPGGYIYGIDLYEPFVRDAQAKGLEIALGFVEDMSMYVNEQFGLVCSRHVMEHLGDLEQGMSEILRVTVSGGYIAQVTPNMDVDLEPAHLNLMDAYDWSKEWENTGRVKILSAVQRPFHGGEVHLVMQKI